MKKILFAAAVLFFAAGTASGEDVAGILAKIKAKEAKKEAEFKDIKVVMDSKMTAENMEMENTMMIVKKGKKTRTEVSMMGMKTVMINDGKDIWMMNTQQGKRKVSSETEAGGQSPFGWSDSIQNDGAKVSDTEVNGKKCYAVEGLDKQKNKGTWYVDKSTLSLLKYEGNHNGKVFVLINSDFKKVSGDFEMPYKMDVTNDGKQVMTNLVKSVEFNKGVDDSMFNIDSVKQEDLGKMDMNMMMKMMKKK